MRTQCLLTRGSIALYPAAPLAILASETRAGQSGQRGHHRQRVGGRRTGLRRYRRGDNHWRNTGKEQIFRMVHLGYFDSADMFAVIAAFERILRAIGSKAELSSGVTAVRRMNAGTAIPSTAKA